MSQLQLIDATKQVEQAQAGYVIRDHQEGRE